MNNVVEVVELDAWAIRACVGADLDLCPVLKHDVVRMGQRFHQAGRQLQQRSRQLSLPSQARKLRFEPS